MSKVMPLLKKEDLNLLFEGHKWFDLLKTGKAFEKLAPVGMKEYMTFLRCRLAGLR